MSTTAPFATEYSFAKDSPAQLAEMRELLGSEGISLPFLAPRPDLLRRAERLVAIGQAIKKQTIRRHSRTGKTFTTTTYYAYYEPTC